MKNKGFTLLEVLVAIVIFSIGLLGLAGLQIISLRLTDDSLLRTIATIQSNDMIDRMRANVDATILGAASPYNNPNGVVAENPNCLGKDNLGNAIDITCNATAMANHDMAEWNNNLGGAAAVGWRPAIPSSLPSGTGIVCIDSTPNDGSPGTPACDNVITVPTKPIFAVKVWWVERKDARSPGVTHRHVTSFAL